MFFVIAPEHKSRIAEWVFENMRDVQMMSHRVYSRAVKGMTSMDAYSFRAENAVEQTAIEVMFKLAHSDIIVETIGNS